MAHGAPSAMAMVGFQAAISARSCRNSAIWRGTLAVIRLQSNVETASPSWSTRENVIQSQRYDRLVETNRAFREARVRKECGPITDPQLHQQCLDSFARY